MKSLPLLLYALDPVHIGSGGYRMGRVDLTVVRDVYRLPYVPGSSLNGVVRCATLYRLPPEERERAMRYARAMLENPNQPRPHSGEEDPIARIFGYAEGEAEGRSRIGMVAFRDAQILAFPVPTVAGPRWITTAARLEEAGIQDPPAPEGIDEVLLPNRAGQPGHINMGSFLLQTRCVDLSPLPYTEQAGSLRPVLQHLSERLVIVHDDLFPVLVNGNVEVRTSVTIDFETGAAAEGLLYTYEAVPRGTLFLGQIDLDDDRFPEGQVKNALHLIKDGLKLACALGIGAMTTRGFGRMRFALIE